MSIWQTLRTPKRTFVPFCPGAKHGEARRLANLRARCSVSRAGSISAKPAHELMTRLAVSLVIFGIAACAHGTVYVAGTRIPYSDNNKSVLAACEEYRLAVERGDADALMLMAHK